MYFRVFIKFRVCTCIHDTRYTIHDIDQFRVYTVTSLARIGTCSFQCTPTERISSLYCHNFHLCRNKIRCLFPLISIAPCCLHSAIFTRTGGQLSCCSFPSTISFSAVPLHQFDSSEVFYGYLMKV